MNDIILFGVQVVFVGLPALLIIAWAIISTVNSRRTGSPWIVSAAHLLAIVLLLIFSVQLIFEIDDFRDLHNTDNAVAAPVQWPSIDAQTVDPTNAPQIPITPELDTGVPAISESQIPLSSNSHQPIYGRSGTARIPSASTGQIVGSIVWQFAPFLTAAITLSLSIPLLRQIGSGDVFAPKAVTYIQTIGWALLIGLTASEVAGYLISKSTVKSGSYWVGAVPESILLNALVIVPGFGLLIVAYVFKSGAQQRELQVGTI